MTKIEMLGRIAYCDGTPRDCDPFGYDSPESRQWQHGWEAEQTMCHKEMVQRNSDRLRELRGFEYHYCNWPTEYCPICEAERESEGHQQGGEKVNEHEHTFCPHCKPCRRAARMVELEDALRSLASWLGNGGYNAEGDFNVADFEAKIREGVDSIIRVEVERRTKQCQREGGSE